MCPAEIPTRLFKELAEELTPIFSLLYQACLDQGTIPDDWKTTNVVPIFNKRDRNKPENELQTDVSYLNCLQNYGAYRVQ